MARRSEWLSFATTVTRIAHEADVRYLATAFAYYTFLSLMPLLVMIVALVSWQFAGTLVVPPAQFLTPDTQQLVFEALTTASGRTGSTVLSVVALAWGGANIATVFLTVIERVEAVPDRRIRTQLRDGCVVLGALAVAMVVIIAQSVLLSVFGSDPLTVAVGFAALLLALTLTFSPLYYLPSRLVGSPSAALPGALVAASGWTVIHAVIQFYVLNAAQYAIYGVLSGIIIILTSTYFAASVLMVGVAVNAVRCTDPDELPAAGS